MDVVPVSMGPKATAALLERLRTGSYPWTAKAAGDRCHPCVRLAHDQIVRMGVNRPPTVVMLERDDTVGVGRARADAAAMISLLLHPDERPVRDGIGARLFLATLARMLEQAGRKADVHARGPWLPLRICPKDDGPAPFGPRTLAAWNAVCAPGLQVTNEIGKRRYLIGGPQALHASPRTIPDCSVVEVMRTIAVLQDLVAD